LPYSEIPIHAEDTDCLSSIDTAFGSDDQIGTLYACVANT
jgi:hypothetical protein